MKAKIKIIYFVFFLIVFTSKLAVGKTISLDRTRAKIESQNIVILQSEINNFSKKNKINNQELNASKEEIEKKIIEKIAIKKIKIREAEKRKIVIDDYMLEEYLEKMLNDSLPQVAKHKRKKIMIDDLKKRGIKYEDYREQVRKEIQIYYITQLIVKSTMNLNKTEVERLAKKLKKEGVGKSKYNIGEISIKKNNQEARKKIEKIYEELKRGADFKKLAIHYSDGVTSRKGGDWGFQQIKNFNQKTAEEIKKTAKNEITKIIELENNYQIIKVYDINIENQEFYLEYQIRHITLKASPLSSEEKNEKKIKDIYNKLQQKQSFEKLAKIYSDDKETSDNGGLRKKTTLRQMSNNYAKIVKKLKINQYSDPFKNKREWCIIQLVSKSDNTKKINEIYSLKAREIIEKQHFVSAVEAWHNSLLLNNKIEYKY